MGEIGEGTRADGAGQAGAAFKADSATTTAQLAHLLAEVAAEVDGAVPRLREWLRMQLRQRLRERATALAGAPVDAQAAAQTGSAAATMTLADAGILVQRLWHQAGGAPLAALAPATAQAAAERKMYALYLEHAVAVMEALVAAWIERSLAAHASAVQMPDRASQTGGGAKEAKPVPSTKSTRSARSAKAHKTAAAGPPRTARAASAARDGSQARASVDLSAGASAAPDPDATLPGSVPGLTGDAAMDPVFAARRAGEMLAALDALAEVDSKLAHIARLRWFAGLTLEGIATLAAEPLAEIRRHWGRARAFLAAATPPHATDHPAAALP